MMNKISVTIIIILILAINALRFWHLGDAPYGFHVDELSGAVNVQCLSTEGVDAHLIPHPLFSDLHYGTPRAPVYTYPAVGWAKIFGWTAESLRAFTAFFHIIGLIGLFLLARLFFGSAYALITILVASLSPWAWVLSRLAYDSPFSASFLIWGLWFFLRSNRILDKSLSGLLLCAAMYAYPPTRAHIPLMLPILFIFDYLRQGIRKRTLMCFLLCLILPAIPLFLKTVSGEIQGRFTTISMFAPEYLASIHKTNSLTDLTQVFFSNYFLHLTPEFLFLKGDPSLVHSTGHFGIFGALDILGFLSLLVLILLLCLKKTDCLVKDKNFIIFLVVNFLIGIIPAALTNSELPNSLRILGSWPFACMLISYGLWQLNKAFSWILPLIILSTILYGTCFFHIYFKVYPDESKGMFNFWTKNEAQAAKTDEDWIKFMANYSSLDYHFRYYLMLYRGETCTNSRVKWQTVRQLLGLPKIY